MEEWPKARESDHLKYRMHAAVWYQEGGLSKNDKDRIHKGRVDKRTRKKNKKTRKNKNLKKTYTRKNKSKKEKKKERNK
jgi:hypothetical protein